MLFLIAGASSSSIVQRDIAPEASRLIEVLGLARGGHVADIGAGSGEMTVELARQLGPDSLVYSTDINKERLGEISKAVAGAALENVTIVEGHATRTNLPDACCDALFVRHVYHHFGDPAAMNASIRRALKPGGRFAVMDFPPRKPVDGPVPPDKRASGDTHGVTSEAVVAELKEAGFEILEVIPDWPGNLFLVLARSPDAR